jgi:hypothetical protein
MKIFQWFKRWESCWVTRSCERIAESGHSIWSLNHSGGRVKSSHSRIGGEGKSLEVGITTLLINRELAIAAVPGEPLQRLQRIWKEQADVPNALFYGYTFSAGGTWPGYIPDLRSAAYGGYGADVTTRIEVGAGEKIMLRHLTNLYDLRGMWRDKPGQPCEARQPGR